MFLKIGTTTFNLSQTLLVDVVDIYYTTCYGEEVHIKTLFIMFGEKNFLLIPNESEAYGANLPYSFQTLRCDLSEIEKAVSQFE